MVKLMVVDDAHVVRELVGLVVKKAPDIELVASASSGSEAMAALATTPVDVIVVDMHLPDIDGSDLLALLSAEQKYGLVILSGSVDARVTASYPSLAAFSKDRLVAEHDVFLDAVRHAH